jgi:hypothetical protein
VKACSLEDRIHPHRAHRGQAQLQPWQAGCRTTLPALACLRVEPTQWELPRSLPHRSLPPWNLVRAWWSTHGSRRPRLALMEGWVELSTSSWLVAHGNMHADEQRIRPLYWGMSWMMEYLLIVTDSTLAHYTDRHPRFLRLSSQLCLFPSLAPFTQRSTH